MSLKIGDKVLFKKKDYIKLLMKNYTKEGAIAVANISAGKIWTVTEVSRYILLLEHKTSKVSWTRGRAEEFLEKIN